MKLNFGLMAVDEEGNLLHFCGYEEPPTNTDRASLQVELATDPEFNLIDRRYTIVPAPQAVLAYYRETFESLAKPKN